MPARSTAHDAPCHELHAIPFDNKAGRSRRSVGSSGSIPDTNDGSPVDAGRVEQGKNIKECHLSLLRRGAGDERRTALECEIGPEPIEEHRDPITKPHKKKDMNRAPEQPGEAAGKPHEAEIGDSAIAPDRREIAKVAVTKRFRRAIA
jgi:hypothetical protein